MAIARKISINNETYELEPSKGQRVYVGTCSTAAATNPKVCTVETFPVDENNKPYKGTEIVVKFTATNTSTSTTPQLNVNGTGAIRIWYNNAVLASTKSAYAGYANRYLHYVYDGTYWVFMGHSVDNNSTYSNVALGQGYAVQNNSAASATITATLGSYALAANGIVSVKFTYDVPANATLNINGKGAKAIYNKNAAITSGVIKAGDTATFIYNTYYRLISVDRWQDKQDAISDLATIRSGASKGATAIQQADLAAVATSGSYNDLADKPNIPTAVTVDSTITQNGTNPVQGGAIYRALDNKANINGSVSEVFNASTLQVFSNDEDEGVMMNAVYSDDEMRLRFIGSVDGGSLDYTFDGSGSTKTIATTADIASCVPTIREINNKPLSNDITLNASDVGAVPTVISTTYNDLVTVRTNSQLTEGAWYRITDYTCTTSLTDTKSAGHQFDILVQAISPNRLSEEAKAIRHEGDTYFADANLEDWKIWYCLDNDTTRFVWADATNGKGVIYRMIDEWNNDCPYDFKNIQFKRYKITATTKTDTWLVGKYMAATTTMKEHTVDANDFVWCYTFNGYYASWNQEDEYIDSNNLGSDAVDLSKFNYSSFYDENSSSQGCARNVIPYHIDSDNMSQPRISLNNIVMYGWVTDVSTLPSDYEDLYGDLIFQMMSTPYSNIFGDSCNYITFGSGCISNTFGNYCNSNTFGSGFSSNTFGNNCNSNAFGYGCNSNTFGNGCYGNTFGNNCYFNTFGNSCSSNTFGNSCYYNMFENNCTYNTFGYNCSTNTFGDGCYNNTFSKPCTQYVIVENGNMKITLTSTQTPTSSNPLRNITIAQGVNNTTTTKTISHNTLKDTFRTTYTTDVSGNIYAIAPAKYAEWDNKQSALVSGTDIKTINNQSLLGSGNLTASDIGALSSKTHIPADQVNSDWDASSGVAQILNKPSFKTINGESIIGTGDIEAGSSDVATAFTITITSTTIEVQPMTGAMMTVGTDVSFQVV